MDRAALGRGQNKRAAGRHRGCLAAGGRRGYRCRHAREFAVRGGNRIPSRIDLRRAIGIRRVGSDEAVS